jgi:LPS export ABC transporter protein LptC
MKFKSRVNGFCPFPFSSPAQFVAGEFFLLLGILVLSACSSKKVELAPMPEYKGPLITLRDLSTIYSDSAQLKIKLTAPLQEEYENGNRSFPNGINIVFYKEDTMPGSTLVARKGYYEKATQRYTVTGNVVVENKIEGKKLSTEELNWDPQKQIVFTDKFVVIETSTEILKGEGLEANQNFTKYKILKPTGVFSIND